MDIISAIFCVIGIIFLFSFGFFLGYREGMATGKKYKIVLSEKYVRKSENGKEWFQFPVNISGQLVAIQTIIPLDPYTEPNMEQVRKEAYDKCMDEAEMSAYKLYSPKIDEAYQRGLSDAWYAARKIVLPGDVSGIYLADLEEIFDRSSLQGVIKDYSASECIEKIRQYEQEKEEIKVGDEVIPRETEHDTMIVTRLWKDDCDFNCIDAIGFDGRISSFLVSRVSKTGKHYEIAAVLAKMKES